MIGYYQSGGDGTGIRWVSGYRPGCSPQQRSARYRANAKRRAADKAAGIKRCRLCKSELPTAGISLECAKCREMLEAERVANVVLEERRRVARLRHGNRVVIAAGSGQIPLPYWRPSKKKSQAAP